MRFLLLLLCCAPLFLRAEVTTVRVWPEYRSAESFDRIGEFFTGKEVTGNETVVRTQPQHRAGFYFLCRFKNSGETIAGARIELKVITPNSPTPLNFDQFPALDLRHGSHVVHVGLTGTDWETEKVHPVAWQLRVLDAGGNELTREASFLWGK